MPDHQKNLDDVLLACSKPSRYIGGEVNAVHKDRHACRLSVALAFPDTYEVGMSHLGIQILYEILNGKDEIVAERCFSPWPDMEDQMRRHGILLATLESRTPLQSFDLVGFSLQYELSFTNVLAMLDLGGIPIRRQNRRDGDPIVIAGGPCCFNPAPMSAFIDAFVIGEGEEVILEIAAAMTGEKGKGSGRDMILAALADIEGVYVPAVHDAGRKIRKRIVADLNAWIGPVKPLAPLMKTIHDRIVLEIARGCTRGCRFCQAGMVWRPVRERHPALLQDMADAMLAATGQEELSLLSLSSGDYSCIETLLPALMDRYYARRIALALPSLRVETLSASLIETIKRVRKTSFTLAPEAGTQRLRNSINKGNTEEDLLKTSALVFDAGWRAIKLYFMIGLPGEEEEDQEGIASLAHKVLRTSRNRGQVTVSLSTFVPKPHTPFQWERQIGLEEISAKQSYFKSRLRHRNIQIKWHDARMSLLEGLFSRGDESLGPLIETAYRDGCRFDGWSDQFRNDRWENAMARLGIEAAAFLGERPPEAPFPWDHIDCGVDRRFLLEEAQKAHNGTLTADCRLDGCYQCGVCDHIDIRPVDAEEAAAKAPAGNTPAPEPSTRGKVPPATDSCRFRLSFQKKGVSRYLSHLEVASALSRGIVQSGLKFIYSEGFHPHPKISFAVAAAVGLESEGEYCDIQIIKPPEAVAALPERINRYLPEGMTVFEMVELPQAARSLTELIRGFQYRALLPDTLDEARLIHLEERIDAFLRAPQFTIAKTIKERTVIKDIRPLVSHLACDRSCREIVMDVRFSKEGAVRAEDILVHALALDVATALETRLTKTATFFVDK
ncbi:MAG: TIGR03960 family B12-binding radical SAM protein [Syntrophales bacterium]